MSSVQRLVRRRPVGSTWTSPSMMSAPCGRFPSTIFYDTFRSMQSVTAAQEGSTWKKVYREFLLAVHPDFFHEHPQERAVNEKNLKVFQQHLQHISDAQGESTFPDGEQAADSNTRLVFFLKPASTDSVSESPNFGGTDTVAVASSSSSSSRASPQKVILPLESHRKMAQLLFDAGITAASPLLIAPQLQPQAESVSRRPQEHAEGVGLDDWVSDLFGERAANRAWYEEYGHRESTTHRGRGRSYSEEGASSFGGSESGAAGLGGVLATDAGRNMVRERRTSARHVQELIVTLQQRFGFGKVAFRCGWSKSNLAVALGSLLETCDAHRLTFRVPNFGGLDVVFRNDPSLFHDGAGRPRAVACRRMPDPLTPKRVMVWGSDGAASLGEIRICPADVPIQWVNVLQGITPAALSVEEKRAHHVTSLETEASALLGGARLARGLSCSKRRYQAFLEGICREGAREDLRDLTVDASSSGCGSVLCCKVEEGFSRTSKVLEDGAVQVGSDMTLATLRRCLARDHAAASSAARESGRLASAAAAAAARCRQQLGLESIERARAVTLSQMVDACEALLRASDGVGGHDDSRGGGGDEATGSEGRKRLRGHCVMVVGTRLSVLDGVTEDGKIAIPWNWAGESGEGSWQRGRSDGQSFSSF